MDGRGNNGTPDSNKDGSKANDFSVASILRNDLEDVNNRIIAIMSQFLAAFHTESLPATLQNFSLAAINWEIPLKTPIVVSHEASSIIKPTSDCNSSGTKSCPLCGKKFTRNWLLKGHIRTHTGEKPFGCDKCGRTFADNSNLRAHKQTHSKKRFACANCNRRFALKAYLNKHKLSACAKYRRQVANNSSSTSITMMKNSHAG